MSILDGFRIFLASILILFAPGLAWSYVFFPRGIDWTERAALALGLSIALVPLTIFWLNWLFQVKITLLNTYVVVGGLTGTALVWVWASRQPRISHSVEGVKSWFRSLRGK